MPQCRVRLGASSRSAISAVAAGLLVTMGGVALSQRPAPDSHLVLSATPASNDLEPGEDQPGGAATSHTGIDTADAFSQLSANMAFARELDFKIGNGIFRRQWVSAPSSTKSANGLGPLFNARACQSCHLKDGRGHPPLGPSIAERSVSMFLRLSIPPQSEAQRIALRNGRISVVAEPTYGTQLQELGIQGHPGEGRMVVEYEELPVRLGGGELASLRMPTYRIVDLGYGPLHPQAMYSPRMTPQMIGLGLLEAIPEAELLAREDQNDRDRDGISGKANRVWSVERGKVMIGRFGWKAGQPTVLQQSAEAFAGDIGIGNWIVPRPGGDCTPAQKACRDAPHGGSGRSPGEEINRKILDLVGFYARNLAVPARRRASAPTVLAGKRIFSQIGCAACHTPSHRTGNDAPDPHLRGQLIWPYTNLLLHDMGDGLADNRPEGLASGREWRTAPLWGIGLTEIVNGHSFFLHDGRARNLTEAILWHGGEAQKTRDAFVGLSPRDRAALLDFVNSL